MAARRCLAGRGGVALRLVCDVIGGALRRVGRHGCARSRVLLPDQRDGDLAVARAGIHAGDGVLRPGRLATPRDPRPLRL